MARFRRAAANDVAAMIEVYRKAATMVGPERYTNAQVLAWTKTTDKWQRFETWAIEAWALGAADTDDHPVGFVSLEQRGEISSLYVTTEWMRIGIRARLLRALLEKAKSRGLDEVSTAASEFSHSLFAQFGFIDTGTELTELHGESYRRYLMSKSLGNKPS